MKVPHFLVLVFVCILTGLSAAEGPPVTSSTFDSTTLSEPGKGPDPSMLPTLQAVTSEGMPALASGLNTASTRVPESAVAGFVALFGYILILRRRTV